MLDTPFLPEFIADVRVPRATRAAWSATYDERTGEARPFRSGYANSVCVI